MSVTNVSPPPGRYLTFRLGGEQYGVGILVVREIIELAPVTRVPDSRPEVRGVINLRGRVVPLVDLKLAFGQGPTEPTELTVIVVLQCGERSFGVLADEVLEVVELPANAVGPSPVEPDAYGPGRFLVGTGRLGDRLLFLLDLTDALGPSALAAA